VSRGFVLDSGALIAFEVPSKQRRLAALFAKLGEDGRLVTSAGCLAEVWRGSDRQAPLAMVLRRRSTQVVDITAATAKAIGAFLGRRPDGDDIVDAHVVMLARHGDLAVITSDPGDLLGIDPELTVVPI
jgi:hypothetical protein